MRCKTIHPHYKFRGEQLPVSPPIAVLAQGDGGDMRNALAQTIVRRNGYMVQMSYVSSLSGGAASAVAHVRAIHRYGSENVLAWFADTQWEDEDLYRFLSDFENFIGQKIYRHTEGITPLEVAENQHIIPNQKLAADAIEPHR